MTPKNESELAECIAAADAPLRIQGGGTRPGLGNRVDSKAVLETRGLSGITLYEPAALTLVAQAGTPVAEIEAALDAEGQQLSFEPMDHRAIYGLDGTPTIGAVVAGNISGPRRIQAGACRDSLIGVRFVDGQGRLLKNGGRVMKNVTGYDLVKLMAGSWGSLGVLTEVSFKVLPKPEASATLVLNDLTIEEGVACLCRGLGSPNDITGAAFADGKAYLRIEGFKGSVAVRIEALQSLYTEHASDILKGQKHQRLWASLRDAEPVARTQGDIWRVSVKPTDAPRVVSALEAKMDMTSFVDWGGGLIWLSVPQGTDIRPFLSGIQGHATCIRGGVEPAFHPSAKGVAAIEAGLRKQFDPRGILNTGIMG